MRDTTKALINHYVDQLHLSGQALEIGGRQLASCAIEEFPEPRFAYRNLSREAGDIPQTIQADITNCRDTVVDESFDIVVSCDVFEHINRPWLAAAEIARILRPGGVVVTNTLFARYNRPGQVDYWSYAPESLEFLFGDLECLEKGYDESQADRSTVYYVGRKGSGPAVPRFLDTDHPLAGHLRSDSPAVVTDPPLSKAELSLRTDPVDALRPVLAEITDRLAELEKLVEDRTGQLDTINSRSQRMERRIGQLDAIDARSRRLERRIDRAVASFPLHTVLRLRRWLHRLLK